MLTDPSTSYDEIPYSDNCFPYTHPDHLATVATFHGLTPPPVRNCRVLELGCARGGNIIPMALGLPEGRFLGIDLSSRQIAEGRSIIEKLGLQNIDLQTLGITDIGENSGLFDYIVCHGVYSWVPDQVRDKILAICSENLAPSGVAYVSYNTYPGWHERNGPGADGIPRPEFEGSAGPGGAGPWFSRRARPGAARQDKLVRPDHSE